MCVYVFVCTWAHVFVGAHAHGGPRLMLGTIHHISCTLFNEGLSIKHRVCQDG